MGVCDKKEWGRVVFAFLSSSTNPARHEEGGMRVGWGVGWMRRVLCTLKRTARQV